VVGAGPGLLPSSGASLAGETRSSGHRGPIGYAVALRQRWQRAVSSLGPYPEAYGRVRPADDPAGGTRHRTCPCGTCAASSPAAGSSATGPSGSHRSGGRAHPVAAPSLGTDRRCYRGCARPARCRLDGGLHDGRRKRRESSLAIRQRTVRQSTRVRRTAWLPGTAVRPEAPVRTSWTTEEPADTSAHPKQERLMLVSTGAAGGFCRRRRRSRPAHRSTSGHPAFRTEAVQ